MPLRFEQLFRAVEPAVEPVTLAEAKAQLRLLHNDDDDELTAFLLVAREWAEDHTSRALVYQSWVARYAGWPEDRTIVVPRPQLSVVEILRYWDGDDDLVELNEDEHYTVDEIAGAIQFRNSFTFPALSRDRVSPVELCFRAGYGDAAVDVPTRFKQAIRLAVASNYGADRSNERPKVSFRAPNAAELLLANLRVRPV